MADESRNTIYVVGAGFTGTTIAAEIRAKRIFGHVVAFRKPFAFEGYCRPDLYVDGVLFRGGDLEIDEVLNPDQIDGIEVYTKPALAPMQFANNMSGCGSIVVWRRKTPDPQRKRD